MDNYYSNRHNLDFINFHCIYEKVKYDYDKECNELGLSREDISDHNAVYKHYVVYNILETVRNHSNNGKPVIVICLNELNHEGYHFNRDKNWNNALKASIKVIFGLIPSLKVIYTSNFDDFIQDVQDKRGEVVDIVEDIKKEIKKTVNFKKAREISIRHKLKFMSEVYFQELKNKMIIAKA